MNREVRSRTFGPGYRLGPVRPAPLDERLSHSTPGPSPYPILPPTGLTALLARASEMHNCDRTRLPTAYDNVPSWLITSHLINRCRPSGPGGYRNWPVAPNSPRPETTPPLLHEVPA